MQLSKHSLQVRLSTHILSFTFSPKPNVIRFVTKPILMRQFFSLQNWFSNTYIPRYPTTTNKGHLRAIWRFKCIIASFDACNRRLFLTEIIENSIFKGFVFIHGVKRS